MVSLSLLNETMQPLPLDAAGNQYLLILQCMRHSKNLFLFILIFAFQQILASTTDSLIRLSDLSFKNEIEKTTLSKFNYDKNSVDIIDLFITSYNKPNNINSITIHKQIDDCVIYLREKIVNKTESQKAKIVYNYVHKTFLKVYKAKNSFSDIFENGEYNCVSGSAIYSIFFSKLSIPYQIMEKPQHVYLIAYPQSHQILIETTIPEKGYYRFNDDFIQIFVKNLYDSKLISKEEFDTTNINVLFNNYYFSSTPVSLVQLAGMQYGNYGIYNLDDKNYENAISEFKKAYFLNKSEGSKVTLKTVLAYQVGIGNYSDQKQVHNLALLCRYNNLKDKEISNEFIKSEFYRVIQTQLIDNSQYQKMDSSFTLISNTLTDSSLKKDISFNYHYELARLGYNGSKDHEYEMFHLKSAFYINPNNANLQSIILGYFGLKIQKNNDPKNILGIMEEFSNTFDFINKNSLYNGIKANCLLELSYQYFSTNEVSKGENHLKEFEILCTQNKTTEPNTAFVEKAYAAAAAKYYKKGDYARSKQFLKTGLLYAPNNFGLKQRLSQF